MRAIRAAAAALLGIGALTACGPAAVAGEDDITPFGFSVQPATVAAGGQVTLRVDRNGDGCRGPATVASPVFDTVTIPARQSTARAVVAPDARPGTAYRTSFTCDHVTGTTTLTIAGGRPVPPAHQPVPPKGVHAGAGGSVAGFDLREIGTGLALVVGSAGAAYHFSRRRPGEDGA
ncbi:lipoprotein [Streptomyces fumigatiscleroticus]|nr:lipoprotein [Streptomyces fumigatiscleroticus]